MILTSERLKVQLEENEYTDAVICLHSSLKSFGVVENGPDTIIEGFLAAGNTILAPAFFYASEALPPNRNYTRNGIDYSGHQVTSVGFKGGPDQVEASMGIIPKTMLANKNAYRSAHPMNSFVAIGPRAKELISLQSHLNVYGAYKRLLDIDVNSYILLCGTGLTTCTPLHFAEELAGRILCRRWALHHDRIKEIAAGGCSDGFDNFRPYIKNITRHLTLGRSRTTAFNFKQLIHRAVKLIQETPEITRCSEYCTRCEDAIAGGPILDDTQ